MANQRRYLDLWPKPYQLRSFATPVMRLSDDVRNAVVFLGFGDESSFDSIGTACLLKYKGINFLVTARHVAEEIGDSPFCLAVNKAGGASRAIFHVDPLSDPVLRQWYVHESEGVDIAVMPVPFYAGGTDGKFITDDILEVPDNVGIGDACYTFGLFRLMQGKKKNLVVVHTGNIALMPQDEAIEVANGTEVYGYLVETSNLRGLSGSPVFVRQTYKMTGLKSQDGRDVVMRVGEDSLFLLGIWSCSWEGVPVSNRSYETRVPVGMGVVTPTARLVEILEQPALVAIRTKYRRKAENEAKAKPD